MDASRKRIKSIFKPFLRSEIKGLDQLVVLDASIPAEVISIYEEMAASRKWIYRWKIKKYLRIVSQIENHNANVRSICDRFDAINIAALYERLNEVSDDLIRSFSDLITDVKCFAIPKDSPYYKKNADLRVFVHNIDKIREEWKLWSPLKIIQKEIDDYDGYILKPISREYEKKQKRLLEDVQKIRAKYYDFSSIPLVTDQIRKHNEIELDKVIHDPLFDDIGGVPLSLQQRRAAVTPENAALVIAGAGSGKTTTICGRIKYLLQRKNVNPEEILLLSYSKKSAEDLAAKMRKIDSRLTVATFHKLGLDIIKASTGTIPVVEEQWDAIIEEFFRSYLPTDPEALSQVLLFYGLYLKADNPGKKYDNLGEQYEELKQEDYTTLRESLLQLSNDRLHFETIKKERVKSYEELAIANFYFINGIDYEYERPYEVNTTTQTKRQYCPDFYLKDYKIYHEHFGIDAFERARQYDPETEQKYLQSILWKRQCHKMNATTMIETWSAHFNDGTVFDYLRKTLEEAGVVFHPITMETAQETLNSIYEGQSFKSFINLIKSFLSLYKARYQNADMFERFKKDSFPTEYARQRANAFLTICESVYRFYMNRIRNEGKIDFDDMILQSTQYVENLNGFRFKYIIVDEFQDISYSRAMFLKRLIAHGSALLFAVGDDWQAIYRFSGCDVNIFLDFEHYFGDAEKYFIVDVFRNSQQLQDAARAFVEKNPEQIKKNIKSPKTLRDPIRVVFYDPNGEWTALFKALSLISKRESNAKVLLLGRNNRDIQAFLNDRFSIDIKTGRCVSADYPSLYISFSTVHASKGLEEDYVILLSAKDALNGFPNKMEDDPLLGLVSASPSNYPYAEERRLWYVALTRTRSYVFIIASRCKPSAFLSEMKGCYSVIGEDTKPNTQLIPCPKCKGGHLVLRKKGEDSFYGCSNYPYCDYLLRDPTAINRGKRCPYCGDFLVLRKGQRGPFFGCNSYPECRYILNILTEK